MGLRSLAERWGRRAAPPAELAAALSDLDRVIAARPELAGAGRTLADVLRAAFLVPPAAAAAVPAPDRGALIAAWGAGVPAFRAVPPAIDGGLVRARGRAVCRALRGGNASAGRLLGVIGSRRIDLAAWWRAGLEGGFEAISHEAAAQGLDPGLVLAVLRLALLPELARVSAAYGSLRPEGRWARGDCPHCGQPPALAESRGLEQRRWLRCGCCAADWPGDRLRCASCGGDDPRALHYRFVEGEEARRRLVICDACGGRLKVVSTLAPLSAPGLLVTELATVHLDLIEGSTEGGPTSV